MLYETPNTKLQAPKKHQAPSSKTAICVRKVGSWSLGFGSFLDLGSWCLVFLTAFVLLASASPSSSASRVKDIAMVAGARDNQLVGYGLVTGIAGDADKTPVYPLQPIANFLQRFGINVPPATLSSKNVAAVVVTADISAFK